MTEGIFQSMKDAVAKGSLLISEDKIPRMSSFKGGMMSENPSFGKGGRGGFAVDLFGQMQ